MALWFFGILLAIICLCQTAPKKKEDKDEPESGMAQDEEEKMGLMQEDK